MRVGVSGLWSIGVLFCFAITLDFVLRVAWNVYFDTVVEYTMVALESLRARDFLCQADNVPSC